MKQAPTLLLLTLLSFTTKAQTTVDSTYGIVASVPSSPIGLLTYDIPSTGFPQTFTVNLNYDTVGYVSGASYIEISYVNPSSVLKNIVIPIYNSNLSSACNHGITQLDVNTLSEHTITCKEGTTITVVTGTCPALSTTMGISYNVWVTN